MTKERTRTEILQPLEVVTKTIESYGDKQEQHHSINHMYQDWRGSMIHFRFIEEPGNTLSKNKEKKLFTQFCEQLEMKGMRIAESDRDAIFQEFLED